MQPIKEGSETVSLYAERERVYPREVHGRFSRLRWAAVWMLLGLYYVMPWVSWGERPAVLFDLAERKFYVLWLVFFPQDFLYLTLFLIICALTLFFFTAIAGRLWCGYACPQTVWTELFMWIERKIEGDRAYRQRLDKAPWTSRKLRLKTFKHGAWLALSLWTGFTFVGYFVPIDELAGRAASGDWIGWETFWVLFYSFATYGNAGWMREQVCIYMCPYARFQSAMFDRDTLLIAYDEARGDPRGSRRRGSDYRAAGLGDCIDCTLCVQVCPTGIDIRDGLQYQCIGCAACVDACDSVMERMGYEPGLVRYTTENALVGEGKRILRPRTFVYAGLILSVAVAALISMFTRIPLELDIIRDRNALYRDIGDGRIENVYTLKVINMDETQHTLTLAVDGIAGLELVVDKNPVEVAAGEVFSIPARVRVKPEDLTGTSTRINFTMSAANGANYRVSEPASLVGPRL